MNETGEQIALGFVEALELANRHIDIWRVLHGQRDISAWLYDDTDMSPDTPH